MKPLLRAGAVLSLALGAAACSGDGTGTSDPVTQILIAPDSAYIRLGRTEQLTASARSASGAVRQDAHLTWASTDTTIAAVSSSGLVTAKAYGTTSITATADGVVGRSFVRVTGTPGVTIVSGAAVSDTIGSVQAQPLVVELRDQQGLPLPGVTLEFRSSMDTVHSSWGPSLVFTVLLSRIGGTGVSGGVLTETTDATGRAAVRLAFNAKAGPARVAVASATLGYADTARYTIQPGAAVRIVSTPKDTAIYSGRSYTLRARVVDRQGNARTDALSYRVAAGPVTIGAAGETVTGSSVGRAVIVAQAQQIADTIYTSVVPQGTISAFEQVHTSRGIVRVNLDGSGYRRLVPLSYTAYYGTWPSWSRSGQIVYEDGSYNSERLMVVDTLGAVRRATGDDAVSRGEIFGSFMPDGSIVFSAHTGGFYGTSIMRVGSIGGVPTRIGPTPHGNANNWKGSPAPDGRRLVYMSVDRGLSIMDVQTGATNSIRSGGSMPRWSPAGDWIVYNEGASLYLIRPDGTGRRAVVPGRTFQEGASWSPDGNYLVAVTSSSVLTVIDVASGEEIPIRWRYQLSAPAWRP